MRNLTKQEVLRTMEEHQQQIQALGVRRCGLFGSFVRGQASDYSDVDVLVEFMPEGKTFRNFMHLVFLLEEVLQRPVDVITVESLSPHIGPKIMQEVEYAAFDV